MLSSFWPGKLVAIVPSRGVDCGNVAPFKAVTVPEGGAANRIGLFFFHTATQDFPKSLSPHNLITLHTE